MIIFRKLLASNAPAGTILVRLMVGAVFLSEGMQKFLYPDDPDRGAARFAKIGFSAPDFTSAFVASFEIICGAFIILGLLTRLAVLPTITIMIVAICTTKMPILQDKGFWDMAHAARTDYAMLLGSVYLLVVGAGPWSVDARLWTKVFNPRQQRGEFAVIGGDQGLPLFEHAEVVPNAMPFPPSRRRQRSPAASGNFNRSCAGTLF